MAPRLNRTDQNRTLTSFDIDSINKNYPLTPAALTSGDSFTRMATSNNNPVIERGVIELMADGSCRSVLLPIP